MRIEDYLRTSALHAPQKTALVSGDRRLTYAEFDDLSDRLATALTAVGVTPGDRVLVFIENSWQAAISVFAVWKAGAVLCPINPSTKSGRLAFIIRNCGASAIIAQGKLAGVVVEAQAHLAEPLSIVLTAPSPLLPAALDFDTCLLVSPVLPDTAGSDEDLAMVIYTSGSTGEPKGVMLTHGNIDAATSSITQYLENTPDDVLLSVLPMAFGYGLSQLLTSVRVGATLVLEKSFAFPAEVFSRIRDERATGFAMVPAMVAMMLQTRDLDYSQFDSLRYMTNAAAALPVAHIERLREALPHVRLFSMYGQTECIRSAYMPPEQLALHPGSVGIAIPGCELAVVDEEGYELPAGMVGELVISGPNVMRGYWDNPAATNLALRPAPGTGTVRLHSGDLFQRDAEGYFSFVARKDDIIKSRGEKVAPKEVEAVIYTIPGVVEALVLGVPDPVLGQAVKALIVSSDPAMLERDVIRYCAKRLDDYMVPKSVEFRESLPKTDTGKLSRRLAGAMTA
ncbi:class I adenylate-forming enzyme family protein [Oryzicola mucosus]|uniref:Acyl--CoA ligase n=1 Tax=Oryzicola mucosus TaxID=2767425 RepID=A0A8J6PJG8_9HYPH|nr:class I adenylate-forming enzyme family protein [Oryzicola mucosus]MBD0415383.1 acyl--CoA ligase [Oryzicola mucosus]